MMGEEVDEALLATQGLVGDRAYAFLDVATGKVASAKRPRRFGALMQCRARMLWAPQRDAPLPPIEVVLPDGTVMRDDLPELERRVSALLDREVQLLTDAPEGASSELAMPGIDDVEPGALQSLFRSEDGEQVRDFRVGMAAAGTMVDIAPLHVVAASTLRRLEAEYPVGDWAPQRLRPNILIDDNGRPGDEDDWLGCHLHIGEHVVIQIFMPVPRCVMTTLPQPGLPKDLDVLRTIARVGRQQLGPLGRVACTGSYARIISPGVVRIGDPVVFRRVQSREDALAAMFSKVLDSQDEQDQAPS
jgi:uncharacterized protein YcbX